MTETLTGKQVLALLAQDEVPEIEWRSTAMDAWSRFNVNQWCVAALLAGDFTFRIKPTPARRLSVTLASGEVVSWPEPVREVLKHGKEYWCVNHEGEVYSDRWVSARLDIALLAFGNIHLTKEAAQEHADALRKINTQGGK